jgi:hypothetical protein
VGKDDKDEDLAGDSQRWAADEETAMWDESAMRESGFGDLAQDREAKPRSETGPATTKEFGGDDKAKVKLGANVTGGHQQMPAAAPKSSGPSALSWVVTVVLALAIGVAVFFVVRMIVG